MHRDLFKSESKEVIAYLQGIHHTRKDSHMQVNYSSTVDKLSQQQLNVPVTMSMTPSHSSNSIKDNDISRNKLIQYQAQMSLNTMQEKDINERKRIFNRECGRKAVVNEVYI